MTDFQLIEGFPNSSVPMYDTLSVTSLRGPYTVYGTNPSWCAVSKTVFYVDTFGKSIIQYNPRTDESEVMVLDELIGFAVPTSETTKSALRLIVGFEKDIVEVNFSKKQVMRTICSVTDDMMVMNGRFNGAKCSPHGYLYVNHLQITEKGLRERLFRLNLRAKDSFLTEVIDAVPVVMHDAKDKSGLHGMCWMTDARTNTLYRIENSVESSSIVAHVVTGDTMHGRMLHVGEKTTIYKLPSKQFLQGHRLNSITVDCKGKIWSAVLGGGCLLRVDPEIGKPSNIVYVPGTYPTGIIFCGPTLDSLFVTTKTEKTPNSVFIPSDVPAAIADMSDDAPGVPHLTHKPSMMPTRLDGVTPTKPTVAEPLSPSHGLPIEVPPSTSVDSVDGINPNIDAKYSMSFMVTNEGADGLLPTNADGSAEAPSLRGLYASTLPTNMEVPEADDDEAVDEEEIPVQMTAPAQQKVPLPPITDEWPWKANMPKPIPPSMFRQAWNYVSAPFQRNSYKNVFFS